tara:strand:+ start:3951 stop:4319 length:369 start_codon:yes stop_codon:yes gene_type:complete
MKHEYKNRYGDIYTFTKQEDGNVLMEGKFEWVRLGDDFIDPSGGPFIKKGQMLPLSITTNLNVIVEGFERVDTGYIIKVKKTKQVKIKKSKKSLKKDKQNDIVVEESIFSRMRKVFEWHKAK